MERCLNKRELLQEMIAFFFKDAASFLPQMHVALRKGDLAEVGSLGHRLKGTLAHLGAEGQETPRSGWSILCFVPANRPKRKRPLGRWNASARS